MPADPSARMTPQCAGLLLVFLIFAALAAYYPAWHGGMLWDDDAHLTKPELRPADGLWRIWFEPGATQQYYPLVHSAFWLQAQLWGDQVLGYHLVTIGLHALSAFLVVIVLRRLGLPGALFGGVVFALHPIQVESVAWMTELKNTLSGVFYLAAVLAYLEFDRMRQPKRYMLAITWFLFALLSKTVTATLPAGLMVIFWWQRGTLTWRRDIRPLIPFLALGTAAALTTVWVERMFIGARGVEFSFTAVERILIAGRAFIFYLRQLLWPDNLIFIYPRWRIDTGMWWQYLFPAAAAAILISAWQLRRSTRAPLAALLFFGISLAPALGFVNVYPFRFSFVADHFQYLANLGIIAAFAAGIEWLLVRAPTGALPVMRAGAVIAIGLPLGIGTWHQSGQYADARILYLETLRRNPQAWLMHLNLGAMADHSSDEGRREAEAHYQAALAIYPDEPQVHNNLGSTWMEMGRYQDALRELQTAVRLAPGYAEAYLNLGAVLQHLGRYDEAVTAYLTALDIKPGLAAAQYNLGVVMKYQGRRNEALSRINQALKLQPDYPEARQVLGDLMQEEKSIAQADQGEAAGTAGAEAYASRAADFVRSGHFEEAVAEYEQGLRRDPNNAKVRGNFGFALGRAGRPADAERELRQALRTLPNDAEIHNTLGNTLHMLGRTREAVSEYARALELDPGPNRAEILNDLGVALASLGRMDEAIFKFREALQLKPGLQAAQANLDKALAMGR